MIASPYGGLTITGGAVTQALTSTAGLLAAWAGTGGANVAGSSSDGDPSIIPDKANNRVKINTPGTYLVLFDWYGDTDNSEIITFQLRKNGSAYGAAIAKNLITTGEGNACMSCLVTVTSSDNPGTLPTFADPSSSGFAGAGGAPKTLCALDVVASAVGTPTITSKEAHLTVLRVA